ncbi:PA1571 family protein [Pseudomonas sp. RIT-PI-S]|uniref:PA1571 family protein n=1 Tax=Pseudomonas sp. RIT-PI-S TaxID=3035295 RepID=UPI0021D94C8B|nr:PA1571 family protein [Pseudomonas sp. RIT-PI-S]
MSLQQTTERTLAVTPVQEHHTVGGAIIDGNGREIPITEQMVREACQTLDVSLQPATRPN